MGYPKHPKMTKINGNTWNTRSKKLFLKLLKAKVKQNELEEIIANVADDVRGKKYMPVVQGRRKIKQILS